MAGMFYSLQEVVEKLQKTEDEIKQIVRQGRLREFRDGPNLLFKVDEVEGLMGEIASGASEEPLEPEPAMEEESVISPEEPPVLEPEPLMEEAAPVAPEEPLEPEQPIEEAVISPEEPPMLEPEPVMEEGAPVAPEEPLEPEQPIEEAVISPEEPPVFEPEPLMEEEAALTAEEQPMPEPVIEEAAAINPEEAPEPEPLMEEEVVLTPEEPQAPKEQVPEEEISLAPEVTGGVHEELLAESEIPAEAEIPVESEMAGSDTSITDQEIDLLSETASTYPPPEDSMAETRIAPDEASISGTGEIPMVGSGVGESPLIGSGSGEASLEEIEEDVNLDSFGSGSGLLDLSLQADDTSLGGILDEIYTAEGEGEAAAPATAEASAMEVAAETEEILAETPRPGLDAAVMARAYIEPEPDALSNALGYMLFLPLLAVIYSSIVVIAGYTGVMPSILTPIQKFIVPIMGGLIVVSLVIVGIPLLQSMGGSKSGAKPKAKKAKKPKKEKKKKAKKGKKSKK